MDLLVQTVITAIITSIIAGLTSGVVVVIAMRIEVSNLKLTVNAMHRRFDALMSALAKHGIVTASEVQEIHRRNGDRVGGV